MTPRVRAPRRFVSLSLAALAMLAAPCLTQASTTLSFSYTGPAVPIPDGTGEDTPGAPAFASIDVSGFGATDVITSVTFRFDGDASGEALPSAVGLDHTFVSDLQISLISPATTEVLMIDHAGEDGANFAQTVLDDSAATSIQSVTFADAPFAGTFAPDTPLATFIGELANGTWMLKAQDFAVEDTGNIRRFTITITAAPPGLAATHWLGGTDSTWSGNNWASDAAGTPTTATPTATDDITFAATGATNQVNTNLDAAFTINSLTINSTTGISTAGAQTLNVNTTTAVNSVLSVNSGVTLAGGGALTIDAAGTLAGDGAVQLAADQSLFANGAISVGDPSAIAGAAALSLTTSGTGSIVMGAGSMLLVDLFTGAGLGDNTGTATAADQLSLHGTLDASAGGTLVIGNPNAMTNYAGGDEWQLVNLNGGAGSITGTLAVDDSSLGLATGFTGTFDQTTGIYSIADYRPELSTTDSGLPFANAEGQALIAGNGTVTNDINNHLFTLRAGGGEEDDEGNDGSIASSMDDGVVMGQGDGPESPMATRIRQSRRWQAFATVNYGNVRLSPINKQAGVQVDAWASGVGIERHVSRRMTLGFAFSFLQSTQTYTGGLGRVELEGPALSAYLSYVRSNVWCNLLYSFGDYDMGTSRNPGFGFTGAQGSTTAYTNTVQLNTGYSLRFQNNTLVMGPFAGVDYLHGSVDGYSETGGGPAALSFARQTFQSLVTRVGWSVSKKVTTDWAVITPQVRLSYERQNVRNNGTSVSLINAPFTATGGHQSPGQDYMVVGAGVSFQFTPTLSLLLNYQTQIFRNNMTAQFASVRLGCKF